MARVKLNNVTKAFGKERVVHGVSLDIPHNEFLVLVGPSGCGKSTTLRMIAGLEKIDEGTVEIEDQVVNDMAPRDRDIAMVFQNYALYPHMTVYENMAFGLKLRKYPKAEIEQRVRDAAEILGISELLARRPKALSGGQRQRVAMGRAIVRKPRVFLFDEPLSNLDAKLRVQMRTEIKKLHQTVATTIIYVTHDQVEAMTLADRIVVMNQGHVEQIGDPMTLYEHPANRFVASFIGSPAMNFFQGRVEPAGDGLRFTFGTAGGADLPPERGERYGPLAGKEAVLGVRPEHVHPTAEPDREALHGSVDVVEPMGSDTMVFMKFAGAALVARMPPHTPAKPGAQLHFALDMSRCHLIDPANGRVL